MVVNAGFAHRLRWSSRFASGSCLMGLMLVFKGLRLMRGTAAGFAAADVGLMRIGIVSARLSGDVIAVTRLLALRVFEGLGTHRIAPALFPPGPAAPPTATAGAAVDLVFGIAVGALFFGDQRLPVSDRDL